MALTTTILGDAVQLTGNPVWVKVSGGSIPAGAVDYKYLLKLISSDDVIDGAPFTDAIPPDGSMEAYFNLSGYVDIPVKALFDYPVSSAIVSYPTQAFNVQVQVGETYVDSNGDEQTNWGSTSSVFQMLKGGLNPRQLAMFDTAGTSFYDTYISGGKFLTARPWGNFVHPTQPVKLWFMPTAGASASFKVKAVYTDATEDTYTKAFTLSTDNLYEFNCNPADLGIDMETAESKINFFDVWIEVGGSKISDTRRFTVDWKYCERPFFLLFANSLGGVDDLYLGGRAIEGIKVNGQVVYKPQERGATVFEPTLIVPNRTGQNAWKINSGWKTGTEMLFVRDAMVSRQVWLLYPNSGVTSYTVVPVNIENAQIDLVDRMEDIYNIDFDLAEAHESQFTFDNRLY